MKEYVVIALLSLGTVFILLATIGLLKMPDVFLRMSASTIAATLGVSSILTALAFHFSDIGVTAHVIGINVFLFLTVPVGAHLMGRAAHKAGYRKWDKTVVDRLEGKYNEKDKTVRSGLENVADSTNAPGSTNEDKS